MSLLAAIPAPTRELATADDVSIKPSSSHAPQQKQIPPYGQRQGYVPRKQEDYGGGGAFPEIHVAQYPLDMGRPDKRGGGGTGGKASQTLALTVNAQGDVNYDAIVKQGDNAQKWIATGHNAIVPKLDKLNAEMPKPDEEEIQETAKATAAAIEALVTRKQASINPKTVPAQPGAAQYIKYTASSSNAAHASGAGSRIIKLQDMPVDPLEPPKFKHIKVPRGAGSPPVPVMHSPPRPMTHKDQQDWKIPPCISNWKNAKGYTIPLDKRLAADGRGLQEMAINDKFASFAEAMYVVEHKSREAIEARGKMQKELQAREKEAKEAQLRDLAARARLDRLGGGAGVAPPSSTGGSAGGLAARGEGKVPAAAAESSPSSSEDSEDLPPAHRPREGRGRGAEEGETRQEREERKRRDEIREERRRERERERRLESKEAHGFKRSKLTRDRDRDVSEKIALGMAKVTGGEAMYDQRLFNQDGGMDTGLAADDAYNLYDKPLFADRSEIFRSKTGRDEETMGAGGGGEEDARRFKPDKGFTGADYGKGGGDGNVQFEMNPDEADPFGLDAFLSDVKSGKKKGALDEVGKGGMHAGGGGGDYSGAAGGNRKMNFTKGS